MDNKCPNCLSRIENNIGHCSNCGFQLNALFAYNENLQETNTQLLIVMACGIGISIFWHLSNVFGFSSGFLFSIISIILLLISTGIALMYTILTKSDIARILFAATFILDLIGIYYQLKFFIGY